MTLFRKAQPPKLHRDREQNLIVTNSYADSNATSNNCGNQALELIDQETLPRTSVVQAVPLASVCR